MYWGGGVSQAVLRWTQDYWIVLEGRGRRCFTNCIEMNTGLLKSAGRKGEEVFHKLYWDEHRVIEECWKEGGGDTLDSFVKPSLYDVIIGYVLPFMVTVPCRQGVSEELVWTQQAHLSCQSMGALRPNQKLGKIYCECVGVTVWPCESLEPNSMCVMCVVCYGSYTVPDRNFKINTDIQLQPLLNLCAVVALGFH